MSKKKVSGLTAEQLNSLSKGVSILELVKFLDHPILNYKKKAEPLVDLPSVSIFGDNLVLRNPIANCINFHYQDPFR